MNDELPPMPGTFNKEPVGNLTDNVIGATKDRPLELDFAVDEFGKVVMFHNLEFKDQIGWFECDLDKSKLLFVFDDGRNADSGIKISEKMAKYIQNAHQILMVLLDKDTGEAKEGKYFPIILQKI
ncbi:MAG: hypothetical protein CBB87_08935 [Micavibrio sp. TMED27]|nr:hypothetical protein [Micavibrio sp.]OUT90785.1 MAG: hypothetical protein CBB87_08935 [Micavibrio sp. TMED27]|tara:strand:+ start:658 stop:1032 length:375 start_codon:yes stop_codon:yes gene_type:complete